VRGLYEVSLGTRVFHVTWGRTRRDPETGDWFWFFLAPRVRWNGGWREDQVIDVSFSWLCFWVSFTLWGSARA
jgi:hypothetical protein